MDNTRFCWKGMFDIMSLDRSHDKRVFYGLHHGIYINFFLHVSFYKYKYKFQLQILVFKCFKLVKKQKWSKKWVIPSWTGLNILCSENGGNKSYVGFLQRLDAPATELSTVNFILEQCVIIKEQLNASVIKHFMQKQQKSSGKKHIPFNRLYWWWARFTYYDVPLVYWITLQRYWAVCKSETVLTISLNQLLLSKVLQWCTFWIIFAVVIFSDIKLWKLRLF